MVLSFNISLSLNKISPFFLNLKWSTEISKKTGLKLNIQKTKIMASGPICSWQTDGEIMETVRVYFGVGGLQNHCRW